MIIGSSISLNPPISGGVGISVVVVVEVVVEGGEGVGHRQPDPGSCGQGYRGIVLTSNSTQNFVLETGLE